MHNKQQFIKSHRAKTMTTVMIAMIEMRTNHDQINNHL